MKRIFDAVNFCYAGVCRIIGADGQAVESLLTVLKQLEAEYGFNAVLTMSVLPEELPESAQQYVG